MLKPGKYKHFKRNFYEVICVAKHSETEEPMVVYKSEKNGSFWVRPLTMFTEKVKHNGQIIDRFSYIG